MSLLTDLERALTCEVCHEVYGRLENPKMLIRPYISECGHTFCDRCVAAVVASSNKNCPKCRFEGFATKLILNYVAEDVAEIYEKHSKLAVQSVRENLNGETKPVQIPVNNSSKVSEVPTDRAAEIMIARSCLSIHEKCTAAAEKSYAYSLDFDPDIYEPCTLRGIQSYLKEKGFILQTKEAAMEISWLTAIHGDAVALKTSVDNAIKSRRDTIFEYVVTKLRALAEKPFANVEVVEDLVTLPDCIIREVISKLTIEGYEVDDKGLEHHHLEPSTHIYHIKPNDELRRVAHQSIHEVVEKAETELWQNMEQQVLINKGGYRYRYLSVGEENFQKALTNSLQVKGFKASIKIISEVEEVLFELTLDWENPTAARAQSMKEHSDSVINGCVNSQYENIKNACLNLCERAFIYQHIYKLPKKHNYFLPFLLHKLAEEDFTVGRSAPEELTLQWREASKLDSLALRLKQKTECNLNNCLDIVYKRIDHSTNDLFQFETSYGFQNFQNWYYSEELKERVLVELERQGFTLKTVDRQLIISWEDVTQTEGRAKAFHDLTVTGRQEAPGKLLQKIIDNATSFAQKGDFCCSCDLSSGEYQFIDDIIARLNKHGFTVSKGGISPYGGSLNLWWAKCPADSTAASLNATAIVEEEKNVVVLCQEFIDYCQKLQSENHCDYSSTYLHFAPRRKIAPKACERLMQTEGFLLSEDGPILEFHDLTWRNATTGVAYQLRLKTEQIIAEVSERGLLHAIKAINQKSSVGNFKISTYTVNSDVQEIISEKLKVKGFTIPDSKLTKQIDVCWEDAVEGEALACKQTALAFNQAKAALQAPVQPRRVNAPPPKQNWWDNFKARFSD